MAIAFEVVLIWVGFAEVVVAAGESPSPVMASWWWWWWCVLARVQSDCSPSQTNPLSTAEHRAVPCPSISEEGESEGSPCFSGKLEACPPRLSRADSLLEGETTPCFGESSSSFGRESVTTPSPCEGREATPSGIVVRVSCLPRWLFLQVLELVDFGTTKPSTILVDWVLATCWEEGGLLLTGHFSPVRSLLVKMDDTVNSVEPPTPESIPED